MSSSYDPQLAIALANFSEITYTQYHNGPPPGNDGTIDPGPGYTQIASFTAPEIERSTSVTRLSDVAWNQVARSADIRSRFAGIGDVYFGFALTSATHNVIALRGTQSDFEWMLDGTIPQVPVPLVWYANGQFQLALVHLGFLTLACLLADQIISAAKQFDASLPCLVTGHSLGGALAVLVAPIVRLLTPNTSVQMYGLAGPRVGNPAFAGAYDALIPASFRIVNLADLAPMVPPTQIFDWTYADVGEEWSFLNQTGNVAGNHALIGPDNYTAAVSAGIPTNAARTYPVTGLGNAR